MAENIQRNRGRGQGYKFDRGGTPAEFGPYIGVIKNNIDTLRAGRVQVYIEEFAGGDDTDQSLWRTVAYVPPFYGVVEQSGTNKGTGSYIGNPQSYGMWFTPPDIGVRVICFFASGDPNQGYYTGCVPELGVNHMIPAVGASKNFTLDGSEQADYLKSASQLPVTEINVENEAIDENPKFYDQPKPIHSYVSAVLLQQGLITDNIRGPITSNSQRESPSTVYGISTPGRTVTQGSINEDNVGEKANSKDLKAEDLTVVGRRGGHSIVMDDGDLVGFDNLVRIRTSKGHQITMSDDGDCFYIIHANGQTWLEFGTEGTVDVYATNSVNIRTQGDLNFHADKKVNINAGEGVSIKGKKVFVTGNDSIDIASNQLLTLYGKSKAEMSTSGALNLSSNTGGWASDGVLSLSAKGRLDLNGIPPAPMVPPILLQDYEFPDVKFQTGKGWVVEPGALKSIVTRAPTHEPYPYHNRGVEAIVQLDTGGAVSKAVAPAASAVAGLADNPVTNPVSAANILKQNPASDGIGNLSVPDVTSMLASAQQSVAQTASEFSLDKGLGKFGLSPTQLEQQGLLKIGTVAKFGGDAGVLSSVIDSPSIWTGKDGIGNLSGFLASEKVQDQVKQGAMTFGFNELKKTGVITGVETVQEATALIQSAGTLNPADVVDWANGQAGAAITSQINNIAKNALQAVNLAISAFALGRAGQAVINTAGIIDTVSRVNVNSAIVNVINNPSILNPVFQPRDRTAAGIGALNSLTGAVQGQIGSFANSATTVVGGVTGPARNTQLSTVTARNINRLF
jgi:hypothetical protein